MLLIGPNGTLESDERCAGDSAQQDCATHPKPVSFSIQKSRPSFCNVSVITVTSSCLLATRALLLLNFGSAGRSGRPRTVSAKSLN